LPSTWWCSWSVSAGMLFFDLFCGGIVSYSSAETRWAPMLGGTWKIRIRPPNTREGNARTFRNTNDIGGDKESPKDSSRLKSCECFYMCPRAPFYRETKGLLHSENTLQPKEYS
jgi:hypothetical protein